MSIVSKHKAASAPARNGCEHFPDPLRMNYFYGQMLGARDFLDEQAYFRNRLKLIHRCLHGYGVVCGLEVCAVPSEQECPPRDTERRDELDARAEELRAEKTRLTKLSQAGGKGAEAEIAEMSAELEQIEREREQLRPVPTWHESGSAEIRIKCGFALDCMGNELVVRCPIPVDVAKELSPAEMRQVRQDPGTKVYVSLRYAECGVEPTRPIALEVCSPVPACSHARIREGVCVQVSLEPPDEETRCEFCCEPHCDSCVLLAVIDFDPDKPIDAERIDNGVRRPFGLYEPTVITGISWQHGATYPWADAHGILGRDDPDGGIVVHFSRPVRVETVRRGVFDLWRILGEPRRRPGAGMSGPIIHIVGEYVDLPQSGFVTQVKYRDLTTDNLDPGDRVIVIVRTSFILDECCQPVDGLHVGGKVPQVPSPQEPESIEDEEVCRTPPGGFGPWTSGNGVPGGTFESWFYVE